MKFKSITMQIYWVQNWRRSSFYDERIANIDNNRKYKLKDFEKFYIVLCFLLVFFKYKI